MTTTNYNLHQQIFAVCLGSNITNGVKDTQKNLQSLMYTRLLDAIKTHLGDWKIGWGPVVWKEDPESKNDGAGNSWFVARNPALEFEDGSKYDTHVVSIAGSASIYNWRVQNLCVEDVVDFTKWVKTGIQQLPKKQKGDKEGTYIACGTAAGVYNLVTNAVPSGPTGVGTGTLIDYLSNLSREGTKVIFTGFSLGGALSPTLALAVRQSGTLKGFRQEDVLVYPLAGPTPGNGKFAQEFESDFPRHDGPNYRCWNMNIVNLLDIVPQAWCDKPCLCPQQNIQNMRTIWGLLTPLSIKLLAGFMLRKVEKSGITYFPLPSRTFKGEPVVEVPQNPDDVREMAKKQHIEAYNDYIDVHIGGMMPEDDGLELAMLESEEL